MKNFQKDSTPSRKLATPNPEEKKNLGYHVPAHALSRQKGDLFNPVKRCRSAHAHAVP